MKPCIHSSLSVRKYGGQETDYQEVHEFLDMSKMTHGDTRHRAILHNTLGAFLAERGVGLNHHHAERLRKKYNWTDDEYRDILALASNRVGTSILNSDGNAVSVRDIAEQHIIQDMGQIPSVSMYLDGMPFYDWLGHGRKAIKKIIFRSNSEE